MLEQSTTVICLLGSNLGDRAEMLRRAIFMLAQTEEIEVLRASHMYETPPWGVTDQPPFLNGAVGIKTSLLPSDLLDRIHEIERDLGRPLFRPQWSPRLIDIDIGIYGSHVYKTARLTIPHPRLRERAFALIPLLEILPFARDPVDGTPYCEALADLALHTDSSYPQGGLLLTEAADALVASAGAETGSEQEKAEKPGGATPFERAGGEGLYYSRSTEETEALAEALARTMNGGEAVALVGNLGAGKTCFARGFARGLGIEGPITSPSYVLVKSYEGRLTLHHADFYRLSEPEPGIGGNAGREAVDLDAPQEERETEVQTARPKPLDRIDLTGLGLEDYLDDPEAVVLIEWADRFPDWLEPPFWIVQMLVCPNDARMLHIRRILPPPKGMILHDRP